MACKSLNKAIKRKDKGREGAREEGRGDGGTRALTQRKYFEGLEQNVYILSTRKHYKQIDPGVYK